MQASVEYRNVMKENEDDLSLFFEMRNREMGGNDLSLLQKSDDFDDSFGMMQVFTFLYQVEIISVVFLLFDYMSVLLLVDT